ncbi:MAG: sulfatase-like hydrolase/transferase [Candidatus Eremiobacteraeota bacterium]|nr:sulfatase-like hydrolase/transferase [Candidatus Eremiobacteraeota bacterium]
MLSRVPKWIFLCLAAVGLSMCIPWTRSWWVTYVGLHGLFLGLGCIALALILFWLPRTQNLRTWTLTLMLWMIGGNLWKVWLIQDHLDSPVDLSGFNWCWQAFSLAGLVVGCQLLSRRHWHRLVWCLQVILCNLFLIDQLYERYFDDVPGLYLLTQLNQAKSVIPSTIELLSREDLVFPGDLLLTLPLLFLKAPLAPIRKLTAAWFSLPLVLSVIFGVTMDPEDLRILRLRFRNVAAVQRLGLFHYHFYDVLQMAYSRWENLIDSRYDEKMLSELVRQSRKSIRHKNDSLGMYRGKNLIIFQLESFEWFVFNLKVDGQPVTPFLNELAKESWTGGLQDQSGQGRSSDGEFILINSLLPPGQRPLVYAYPSNYYEGLPALLSKVNYLTSYAVAYYGSFWNCRYMARRYGFKRNLFRDDLPADPNNSIGWGLSDFGLVNRLKVHWQKFPRPFFAYVVTMMGHYPYRELSSSQERLKLPAKLADKENMLGRYLQLCRERDEEWRRIVDTLKQEGIWQSSVIVLVGDHDARIDYEDMALLQPKGTFDEVDKIESDRVFCLIHGPDGKLRGQGPSYAAQVDLMPTLLHLLGLTEMPTAGLGINLLSPAQRKIIVSKTGYSIDPDYVVVDNGSTWSTYARSTHLEVAQKNLPVQKALEDWNDLIRDVLRLNLVPAMLKMR